MLPNPSLWLALAGFLCLLGPLVFFHELGHYSVARLFGIPAETFSIGFGRELVGWTDRQGTRWKIAWLPLGGYVKFVGDMSPASEPADLETIPADLRDRVFHVRPVWQRFLVVLAGPAANFLLAITIYAAIFSIVSGPGTNKVGRIDEKSAAAVAGFQSGDRIIAVAGRKTQTLDEVRVIVEPRANQIVKIEYERGGSVAQVAVKVGHKELEDEAGRKVEVGFLGLGAAPISVFKAVPLATRQTFQICVVIVEGAAKIIGGQGSRHDVGGPIKIAQFAGEAASLGVLPFVLLLALLSINLGFINLLPVPMLDGGHLFFYAVEAVRRRPLSSNALEWAFRGGFAMIIALVLFTTVNDLGSLGLWERLQRLIG